MLTSHTYFLTIFENSAKNISCVPFPSYLSILLSSLTTLHFYVQLIPFLITLVIERRCP